MTGGILSSAGVWVVFIVYFLFLICVAVYTTRKEKKMAGDVDLQTGRFSLPVAMMTYIAACMSVWVFFAGPGAYYRYGLGYFFTETCCFLFFPVICYFTMTKVWLLNQEKHFITPADFFYCRYRSKALTAIIDVVYIICAVPFISAVLVAAGRAANVASGGAVPIKLFSLIAGIIMVIFVVLGGVKSTAFADAFQGWVFIGALWLIIIVSMNLVFGGSIADAFKTAYSTTPEWFSNPGPLGVNGYEARFSYPLCCAFGFTLLLPQVFVRSGYYSQDLKAQRSMALIAPVLQIIVWGGTFLLGLITLAWNPNLAPEETELAIPYLINVISGTHGTLAQVLMVIFVFGVLAVGLSTANALLMTMSSIIYNDFLVNLGGKKFKNEKVPVRIIIAIFGAVVIFVSVMNWDYVYNLMIFADSLVLCLVPCLIFGIYWKKATRIAACISVAAGAIFICLTWFLWGWGWTWYGTIGLVISFALMILVSLFTHDDPKDSEDFYESLDRAHHRFMDVKAKIKA